MFFEINLKKRQRGGGWGPFLREEGNIVLKKFHFWNLNGYSDLSVEEGIVEWRGGEGRGIMGG